MGAIAGGAAEPEMRALTAKLAPRLCAGERPHCPLGQRGRPRPEPRPQAQLPRPLAPPIPPPVFRLAARRKANNDGLFARSNPTPECNAFCPERCPGVRDKPCSSGFYASPGVFSCTHPGALRFSGVVKCLFRRRYSARGGDGVVLGTVRWLGPAAAAPSHKGDPRACRERSCRKWKRPAQSKRQPDGIHSIFLLNLFITSAGADAGNAGRRPARRLPGMLPVRGSSSGPSGRARLAAAPRPRLPSHQPRRRAR